MNKFKGLISISLVLATAFIFGPVFLFIKVAGTEVPPITLNLIRTVIATLFLGLIQLLIRGGIPNIKGQWQVILFMACLLNIIPNTLLAYGETYISSSVAGILHGLIVVFTILFAHYFGMHEPLTRQKVIGVLLGFLGLLCIYVPSLLDENIGNTIGIFAVVLSTVSLGAGTVYGRMNPMKISPLETIGMVSLFSSIILFPLSMLIEALYNLPIPSLPSIASLIILGIITSGYLVYYKSIQYSGATYASLATLLMPIIAMILGVWILNETLLWYHYLGVLFITASFLFFSPVFHKIER